MRRAVGESHDSGRGIVRERATQDASKLMRPARRKYLRWLRRIEGQIAFQPAYETESFGSGQQARETALQRRRQTRTQHRIKAVPKAHSVRLIAPDQVPGSQ